MENEYAQLGTEMARVVMRREALRLELGQLDDRVVELAREVAGLLEHEAIARHTGYEVGRSRVAGYVPGFPTDEELDARREQRRVGEGTMRIPAGTTFTQLSKIVPCPYRCDIDGSHAHTADGVTFAVERK